MVDLIARVGFPFDLKKRLISERTLGVHPHREDPPARAATIVIY